jgi:hypothetical protein
MTQATLADDSVQAAVGGPAAAEGRWPATAFAVAVVAALPLLVWFGRDHWFYLDEWQVLGADGVSKTGYLDGHNGHWITLVRLDYRLNFEVWGLHTYLPYQLPAILGHVASAVLLRQVCRRIGARGWIATAVALAFLFFGTGRENMTLGFQVALTGSLICGFGMFLLAEGPKAVTRRDWLALGLGVVGLMTSSVFLAMLAGFGLTTVLRRGLRVAAFYAAPLGLIYTAWYVAYGRESALPVRLTGQSIVYFRRLLWAVFDALAQGAIVGVLVLIVAAVGLAAALRRAWRSGAWAGAALPVGLCGAWLTFAGLTAIGRADIAATLEVAGRLLHVSAALVLPLVAAGAEELVRRRTVLGVAALVPLAVGLPGNLDRLSQTSILFRTNRQLVSAIAHSPLIDDVPANVRPMQDNGFQPPATAEWLARQAAAGRISEPDHPVTPELALTATSRLALAQAAAGSGQPACPALIAPLSLSLRRGDEIAFVGAIQVTVTDGAHTSAPRRFLAFGPSLIRAEAVPVDVVVRSIPDAPAQVCPPGRGS